jgi:hypothetical protein
MAYDSDWVAYKSRGDPDQPFWIEKTLPKSEWGNQCIRKNKSQGNVTIEGAIISRGGFAVNVQWYAQKVLGVLEYIIEDGEDAKLLVQNSEQQRLDSYRICQEYAPSVRDKSSCPKTTFNTI